MAVKAGAGHDELTQKDDGIPLEDDDLPLENDELVGVLSLKHVDELDEVAVTVLAQVFCAQVPQLTFALDVVDGDLALYHQFLNQKILQRDMLCARNAGTVTGDVQRRRVIDVQWHAIEALIEAQLQHHIEQNTAFFIARATATSPTSIVDCAVSPCSPILKIIGALASITMYGDVDLPLSGLLPQLASDKAVRLKPLCF